MLALSEAEHTASAAATSHQRGRGERQPKLGLRQRSTGTAQQCNGDQRCSEYEMLLRLNATISLI